MGKKQRLRLNEEQKGWLDNLVWYLQNRVTWVGDIELDYFKDAVLSGRYVVLFGHTSDDAVWSYYKSLGDKSPAILELNKLGLNDNSIPTIRWDHYNALVGCETLDDAKTVLDYSSSSLMSVVDLHTLWVEFEFKQLCRPDFRTLDEKEDYRAAESRFKELKKSLKGVRKWFKL